MRRIKQDLSNVCHLPHLSAIRRRSQYARKTDASAEYGVNRHEGNRSKVSPESATTRPLAPLRHTISSRQGPWVWVPPEGCHLVAEDPHEVMDVVGDQQGAHHWAALRSTMAELLTNFWTRTPWPGRACDVCRCAVDVNGEARTMKAAVADGCNITGHPKCKVYECAGDLEKRWKIAVRSGRKRWCASLT